MMTPTDRMIAAAADWSNLPREAMTGAGKRREVAYARFACWAVMRRRGMTLWQIAHRFNRDHSTVVSGLKKAARLEQNRPEFAAMVAHVAAAAGEDRRAAA